MLGLFESGVAGVLADEKGMGKTVQAIAFLAAIRELNGVHGPHLILASWSSLTNWLREFQRWCPSMRVCRMTQNGELDAPSQDISAQDVVVGELNRPSALGGRGFDNNSKIFTDTQWSYLIVDDCEYRTNDVRCVKETIRAERFLFLTSHAIRAPQSGYDLDELCNWTKLLMPAGFARDLCGKCHLCTWRDSVCLKEQELRKGSIDRLRLADGGARARPCDTKKNMREDAFTRPVVRPHLLERLQQALRPFVLRRTRAQISHEKTAVANTAPPAAEILVETSVVSCLDRGALGLEYAQKELRYAACLGGNGK